MARFHGVIGFADTIETAPGVWSESIVERTYFGDVLRITRTLEPDVDQVNDNIKVNNQFSIMTDTYADNHFFAIRYISWMGEKWKVTSAEVRRPRLIMTIGGLYNGDPSPVAPASP